MVIAEQCLERETLGIYQRFMSGFSSLSDKLLKRIKTEQPGTDARCHPTRSLSIFMPRHQKSGYYVIPSEI